MKKVIIGLIIALDMVIVGLGIAIYFSDYSEVPKEMTALDPTPKILTETILTEDIITENIEIENIEIESLVR